MQRIDSHVHFCATDEDALFLKTIGVKVLNICIAGLNRSRWRQNEATPYRRLASLEPGVFAWCTSLASPVLEETEANYVQRVITELAQDFSTGATACKIWKNIGMEDKDGRGRYRMVSDPIFEPIFAYLEREGHPCVMHIGEPLGCWQPLNPTTPHFEYYSHHPQWHMYGRTDVPSHADLMAARDRVLARHPRLRVVGAHLGSLEYDLREVARRLDAYPNFAVDTSGRLADLAWQDTGPVRQFLEHYQDRVLWGSDITLNTNGHTSPAARQQSRALLQGSYELEWSFFTSEDEITVMARPCHGLGLPEAICRKLLCDNARRWYPGV